jgi:hypothetical protein
MPQSVEVQLEFNASSATLIKRIGPTRVVKNCNFAINSDEMLRHNNATQCFFTIWLDGQFNVRP